MNIVYYIEINLICIIMLSLFGSFSLKSAKQQSSLNIAFNWIIVTTILFCISDMVAGVFRGAMFPGAREIITVSNWVYYEALAVISYLWVVYVLLSTDSSKGLVSKKRHYLVIPLIVYTFIALTNFATGFLFVIDENNLYVRGDGVILHWLVTWGYTPLKIVLSQDIAMHK